MREHSRDIYYINTHLIRLTNEKAALPPVPAQHCGLVPFRYRFPVHLSFIHPTLFSLCIFFSNVVYLGGNLANMIIELSKDHLERQMGPIVEENSRGLKKWNIGFVKKELSVPFVQCFFTLEAQ